METVLTGWTVNLEQRNEPGLFIERRPSFDPCREPFRDPPTEESLALASTPTASAANAIHLPTQAKLPYHLGPSLPLSHPDFLDMFMYSVLSLSNSTLSPPTFFP